MPSGVQIGRLFGTDIYASFGFFFLLALPFLFGVEGGYVGAAVWDLAVVVSLLVHEFGHVFAVKWFLKGRSAIVLWMFGGLCVHDPTSDRRKRIAISLMGPAFQIALWAALRPFAPRGRPETVTELFLVHMLFANLVWPLLNLLPILPLDGGQAIRAAIEFRLPPGRALRAAALLSMGVAAAGVAAACLWTDSTFLILLGGLLLLENLKTVQAGRGL